MSIVRRVGALPYRVMRKFAIANVCCFFAAELADIVPTELPSGMRFVPLERTRLEDLCGDYPEHFGPDKIRMVDDGEAAGFAIFDDASLASFLWMATGAVPGALNHAGHPATRLPLQLPSGVGYIFGVFVLPEYRGMRLYGAMMSELAKRLAGADLAGADVGRLMLTTEWINETALRSVRRMGFKLLGRSMLLGIGGLTIARYPRQPMAGGIRTGRYAADTRRTEPS